MSMNARAIPAVPTGVFPPLQVAAGVASAGRGRYGVRRWWRGMGLSAVLLAGMLALPGRAGAGGLPDTVARIKPAIVGIGTFQRARTPPAILRGTGFVVGDGLRVLTNAHVLPEAVDYAHLETLAIFTQGDTQGGRVATVVAVDEEHDVALLKIGGAPLPALRLAESGRVREGEDYAFTGFPIGAVLGLYPVTHRGIVSAISPIAIPAGSVRGLDTKMVRRLAAVYDVYQLDATAYPGNSGSPLYHAESGEVVGILNKVFVQETKESVLERPSGISYAIPIKYALDLLKKNAAGGR